jgi:hypothetical protein
MPEAAVGRERPLGRVHSQRIFLSRIRKGIVLASIKMNGVQVAHGEPARGTVTDVVAMLMNVNAIFSGPRWKQQTSNSDVIRSIFGASVVIFMNTPG